MKLKNMGVSASRNLGIANSSGKYIAFLDSDDVWLPGKILQQCAILERNESVSFIAPSASNIIAAPVLWDMYRQHSESMTARDDQYEDELAARQKFLRWISDYCDKSDLHHPSLEEAIAKELWLSRLSKASHYGVAHHRIRWAKKWLRRLEEHQIPRQLRWIFWNRSAR